MEFDGPLIFLILASLFSLARGSPFDDTKSLPDRDTLVHLFEWKWTDIAKECETFLSKYKYGAVQVSPPNEHLMRTRKLNNGREDVPWWVRYQPVSYDLSKSRSGTMQEFVDMVNRCNKVGVRIVVDAVINHMAAVGQKHPGQPGVWTSAGNRFDSADGVEDFPAVPYSKLDFNDGTCHRDVQGDDYQKNPEAVRNCRLVGLLDLNLGKDYVRQKVADYMNRLIRLGVAGFRVDAVKHIWPADLTAIWNMLENLDPKIYGRNQRPFIMQEVIDKGGEAIKADEYLGTGRVTNFRYGKDLAAAFSKEKNFKYFSNFGPAWSYWPSISSVVFVDNHDMQRDANDVLTYKNGLKYALATAYMLAWPYGYPSVMSSFYFEEKDQGPPTSGSPDWTTRGPKFQADKTCTRDSGWVCEHRWPIVRRMAVFRSVATGKPASNVVTEDHRIAFSRGDKAFFAINNADQKWEKRFSVGLPAGSYCDVISGEFEESNKRCTGATIVVDSSGQAKVKIDPSNAIAIHTGQRVSTNGPPDQMQSDSPDGHVIPALPPAPDFPPLPEFLSSSSPMKRTAIIVQKETAFGQELFLRGGLHHDTHNCAGDSVAATSRCSIPIRHRTVISSNRSSYPSWSEDDNFLDWFGAEPRQGKYNGVPAEGSPLLWTTNRVYDVGYHPLNHYGQHYWIVDVMMDCARTDNGWFELKVFLRGNGETDWEKDIRQVKQCENAAKATTPSNIGPNHAGLCGMINVFKYGQNECQIFEFP